MGCGRQRAALSAPPRSRAGVEGHEPPPALPRTGTRPQRPALLPEGLRLPALARAKFGALRGAWPRRSVRGHRCTPSARSARSGRLPYPLLPSPSHIFRHEALKKSTIVNKNMRKITQQPSPHPRQTLFVPSLLILHGSVIKNSFSCQECHCFTLPSPHLIAYKCFYYMPDKEAWHTSKQIIRPKNHQFVHKKLLLLYSG